MSDDDDFPDNPEQPELPEFDAGDPAAVGARKRNLKIQEREAQRFWDLVFSTRPGRREMWKLLRDCAAFEDKFACGPNGFPQPDASWFHAGVASWGQRMSQTWLINHTAEFALMLKENDPRFQKDSK